jgi:hypothetical protein
MQGERSGRGSSPEESSCEKARLEYNGSTLGQLVSVNLAGVLCNSPLTVAWLLGGRWIWV